MKVSAKQRATLLRQTGPFTTRVFATNDLGAPVGIVFFDQFDPDGIPQSHHILVLGNATLRMVAQVFAQGKRGEDFLHPRDFSPTYFGPDRRREDDRRTSKEPYDDIDAERRMFARRADEDEETGSAVERVLMAYRMGEESGLRGDAVPDHGSRAFKDGWVAGRKRMEAGWFEKAPQRAAHPEREEPPKGERS